LLKKQKNQINKSTTIKLIKVKVLILAGGAGSHLSEERMIKPKPKVDAGLETRTGGRNARFGIIPAMIRNLIICLIEKGTAVYDLIDDCQ